MYNEPIEELNYKNCIIKIYNDEDPENPRKWDNLGTMFYAHRDYILGDKDIKAEEGTEEFSNWQEVENYLIKQYNPEVILPLYLYDHSGLRIKVGSFQGLLPQGHAEFDSGKIGYILVEKEKVRKEFINDDKPVKRITKKLHEQAEQVLRQEIKTFDDYLSGNVYAYEAETKNGDFIGGCRGFFGYQDYMISEAKSEIDYYLERKRKEKQTKVKILIKNNVNLIKRQAINETILS